jgi:hypothetical protein
MVEPAEGTHPHTWMLRETVDKGDGEALANTTNRAQKTTSHRGFAACLLLSPPPTLDLVTPASKVADVLRCARHIN